MRNRPSEYSICQASSGACSAAGGAASPAAGAAGLACPACPAFLSGVAGSLSSGYLPGAPASTGNERVAAAAIDLDDQVGSLEPGKQADLLVLNTPSYQHLGYRFGTNLVDTVIKKGEVVYQSHA